MMLDAGAETDVVNSVGRTAAQMAAFVGTSGSGVHSFTNTGQVGYKDECDHKSSLSARDNWPLTL